MKKEERKLKNLNDLFVRCECSYNNKKDRLRRFGTCLRCGKVLDENAYFKRIMSKNLHKKIKGTYYEK